jgi:hypothetical protein
MFFGSVPVECIEQLVKVVPFAEWRSVYICCSGSFRVEQALSHRFPELGLHSNDVSLYSTALAQLVLADPIRIKFVERLTFMEQALEDAPYVDRVAAVMVAHRMSRFAANNEYCHKHFDYYVQNFSTVLEQARTKLAQVITTIRIRDYFAGDFLTHIDNAIEAGAGVIAFPPFTKGAYEGHFRFLRQSVEWDEPVYPSAFHQWMVILQECNQVSFKRLGVRQGKRDMENELAQIVSILRDCMKTEENPYDPVETPHLHCMIGMAIELGQNRPKDRIFMRKARKNFRDRVFRDYIDALQKWRRVLRTDPYIKAIHADGKHLVVSTVGRI